MPPTPARELLQGLRSQLADGVQISFTHNVCCLTERSAIAGTLTQGHCGLLRIGAPLQELLTTQLHRLAGLRSRRRCAAWLSTMYVMEAISRLLHGLY